MSGRKGVRTTPRASQAQRRTTRASARGDRVSRYDLYEWCAQDPLRDALLLGSIHGCEPHILGEDFAGTGAISRAWVSAMPRGRAIAVDRDASPLARCEGTPGVTVHAADVMNVRDRADVIAVMNFSICEWQDRRTLVAYLRHARSRLRPGGALVASLFGGDDAMRSGRFRQAVQTPAGAVMYEWEQRSADVTTGRIVCAMHFKIGRSAWMRDAFIYDWRLWSIAELREAMSDAGFTATDVYDHGEHAIDAQGALHARRVVDGALGPSYQVLVAGRK